MFQWTKKSSTAAVRELRLERRLQQLAQSVTSSSTDTPDCQSAIQDENNNNHEILCVEIEIETHREAETNDTHTNGYDQPLVQEEKEFVSVVFQTDDLPPFSVERFTDDDDGIHYYTGLESYRKFLFVLSTLGSAAYNLNYRFSGCKKLSVPDQFFLTLVKLRVHSPNFELSRMFNVSESTVCNVFHTWICFMTLQWKELNMWPNRELVDFFMPTDFKTVFPSTRVIIDGLECPIKKPKDAITQQVTFSQYKNRNTAKAVVGSSPGGLVTFITDVYGGSTSDRQIIERSGLIQLCNANDSVMADKGFNVQDLFAPFDIHVNIPTFLKNRNQFDGETLVRGRKVASKRVHIERIIGLAKTYKILCQPMNENETQLGSHIFFVIFMLCNFRSCIIPLTA